MMNMFFPKIEWCFVSIGVLLKNLKLNGWPGNGTTETGLDEYVLIHIMLNNLLHMSSEIKKNVSHLYSRT